ncbi:hypothetical protein [Criibacterium bergeronii]|uniref:hypothetical protein n=1 Tax=Criibacterium bergeronii TaxID=1871336 RepID=UPI002ED61687
MGLSLRKSCIAMNDLFGIKISYQSIANYARTDGYSAYPLAARQFFLRLCEIFNFDVTQVICLTNDDPVSTEFRPFKQIVEGLKCTFKATYRVKCGYDILDGADYDLALWACYYSFLRPHRFFNYKALTY